MPTKPKHRQIFEVLRSMIDTGEYPDGQKLPSEAELATTYDVSRPTVARAMKELERLGLVERLVGSGTFVRAQPGSDSKQFGLIIPALRETEIFVPISRHISRTLNGFGHSLLWGESFSADPVRKTEEARQLCRKYMEGQVAGVFFAPLELTEGQEVVNREIVRLLKKANIPVILLDRDITDFRERSPIDLVSIDHRRAAYILAHHLLSLGLKRIDFVAPALSAPSVNLRIAGYQDALQQEDIEPKPAWIHRGEPTDLDFVREVMKEPKGRAFICANDVTARQLMGSLASLEHKVPDDVRVVGFDDVKDDETMLTTIHQPCEALGKLAVHAMLTRLEDPELPPREILISTELVVRTSCGADPVRAG